MSAPAQSSTRQKRRSGLLFALAAAAALAFLLVRNGESWLRSILLYLSRAGWARRIVTGFPPAWAVAGRFVAGESLDEAIATSRAINKEGMGVALDFLGESVNSAAEAADARDQILGLVDAIAASQVDGYVSVKLSQLGLKVDENLAFENVRQIVRRAHEHGLRVRIDMEESQLVDITLDIYRRLRDAEGLSNVGVVIQSCLYRSDDDVRRLMDEGAWVRLVKGAYKEPPSVAWPEKSATDAAYARQAEMMLGACAMDGGAVAAIATHDDRLIDKTIRFAERHHVDPARFEIQMLYGIRRELQRALIAQGWQVRVYVPYGTAWYPYFMRRLAERPANLWFFVSNFFKA